MDCIPYRDVIHYAGLTFLTFLTRINRWNDQSGRLLGYRLQWRCGAHSFINPVGRMGVKRLIQHTALAINRQSGWHHGNRKLTCYLCALIREQRDSFTSKLGLRAKNRLYVRSITQNDYYKGLG